MAIRPVDIARKLGISTTTLRKYEEFGLVPPVPRSATGYRMYTDEHIAYLVCAREMLPAFTIKEIAKIFKAVMTKKIDVALWIANKAQADLHREKIIAEKIVQKLLQKNGKQISTSREKLTINEVSLETGIPATTIRYWDKVGLISVQRSMENNYRLFTEEHVKQILAIYALNFSVYADHQKHSIERIREDLKKFDYTDKNKIAEMTNNISHYLNRVNRAQIKAISALYHLCKQVESNRFEQQI